MEEGPAGEGRTAEVDGEEAVRPAEQGIDTPTPSELLARSPRVRVEEGPHEAAGGSEGEAGGGEGEVEGRGEGKVEGEREAEVAGGEKGEMEGRGEVEVEGGEVERVGKIEEEGGKGEVRGGGGKNEEEGGGEGEVEGGEGEVEGGWMSEEEAGEGKVERGREDEVKTGGKGEVEGGKEGEEESRREGVVEGGGEGEVEGRREGELEGRREGEVEGRREGEVEGGGEGGGDEVARHSEGGEKRAESRRVGRHVERHVVEQLRATLAQNVTAVLRWFREWDHDGEGTVTIREVRKVLPMLGAEASRDEVKALFHSYDPRGAGEIPLDQLETALKSGGGAPARSARDKSPSRSVPGYAAPLKRTVVAKGEPYPYIRRGQGSVSPHRRGKSAGKPAGEGRVRGDGDAAAPREGNAFKDMQLALDAAPLSLRVTGMPVGDDWAGAADDGAAGAPRSESRFEEILRSSIESIEHGDDADAANFSPEEWERRRKGIQASETTAAAEGGSTWGDLSDDELRVWRFRKTYERVFNTKAVYIHRFSVQSHEVLEICHVEGEGQLLLTATDASGTQVVGGGVVYDSSAHAFRRANAQHKPLPALWSAPGEYLYELTLTPLPGTAVSPLGWRSKHEGTAMKVVFSIESMLTEIDLLEEPAARDVDSRAVRPQADAATQTGHAVRIARPASHASLMTRADEVEVEQQRVDAMKEATHLAQIDARSCAQLSRAHAMPPLRASRAAKPHPSPAGKPAGESPVEAHDAQVAGLEAAWQAAGWPKGSAAAYYTQLQSNGFQIPYPSHQNPVAVGHHSADQHPPAPLLPPSRPLAGTGLRTGGFRSR
ncbi:hypothetical protein AB1Y20_005556 [Prymnesium parvum]|uniref:EF-hand domain-containing protein n=1 Tax=Prymnesium parvum TaxID=97485 RepID=A0AB34J6R7_PRYPA